MDHASATSSSSPRPHSRPARPIRVLYFIGDLGTGGSEQHLARLLLELNRTRVGPSVVVIHRAGSLGNEIGAAGIDLHVLGSQPGRSGIWTAARALQRLLRETKPDVLHTYGYTCQLLGVLASPFDRPPRVLAARRGNEPGTRRHLIYRLTNPFVDHVLCVSEATKLFSMRTEGLSPAKCRVIPNGLDLRRFPRRPSRTGPIVRLGTLGRLRPVKGSDLLLQAFALVREQGFPALELHMGGPADRQWGEDLVLAHRDRPGVVFHGDVSASEFLPTLDLFVLPSRSEGMANALLEAMAVGLPIVATNVGGNAEVLAGGTCGLLVEPTAESIASGLRSILEDPNAAARRADAARERVQTEYDLGVMVERYISFYEEILS